jgi:hypothetical protein
MNFEHPSGALRIMLARECDILAGHDETGGRGLDPRCSEREEETPCSQSFD